MKILSLLAVAVVIILSLSLPTEAIDYYFDSHNTAVTGTNSNAQCHGTIFQVSQSVNLTGVMRYAGSGQTNWYIMNGSIKETPCSTNITASGTFSADVATISGGQILNPGQNYTFALSGGGTQKYALAGAYPVTGNTSIVTYRNNFDGAAYSTYFQDAFGLRFETIPSVSYNATIILNAYLLYFNTSVANFSAVSSVSSNTSVNGTVYMTAANGTNTITVSVPGNISKTVDCVVPTPNSVVYCNATGIYDTVINISLKNRWNNNTVSSFSGWAYYLATGTNITYNTTNGTGYVYGFRGNYTFFISAANYSTTDNNTAQVQALVSPYNHTFLLYTNNSVIVNIFSQANGTPILNTVTVEFIGNTFKTNTTNTGSLLQDALNDGIYDIRLNATGFYTTTYTVTVEDGSTQTVNAYLLLNSSESGQVIFTVYDIETAALIEGASVGQYRFVNGTRVLVETHYTDITGRVQFSYVPNTNYQYIVSKSGYTSETFILSPIIFSSYDIKLRRVSSMNSNVVYNDVNVYYTPKSFSLNKTVDFSIVFYAPNGTLSLFNYSIGYPGGFISDSGTTSQGGGFNATFVLGTVGRYDTVNVSYCYTKVGESIICLNTYTQIGGYIGGGTLSAFARDNYGLSAFESTFLVTIITILMAGAAAIALGPLGAGLVGTIVLIVFGASGFISFWIVVPSVIVAFLLLVKGGGL